MNGTGGSESLVDDFDLFWGIGPSRTETSQRRDSTTSMTPSHSLSSGLMGGLWNHANLEAYGHRHHSHGHVDVMKESSVVSSPPLTAVGDTRRPAHWPSPSPTRATARSRDSSPLGIPRHHHPQRPASSGSTNSGVNGSVDNLSALGSKMDELAALITASVVGKLDQNVRDTLQPCGGILGMSHSASSPPVTTPETAMPPACTESDLEPICSRLATLEDNVAELKLALERRSSISTSGGALKCPEASSGENDGTTASGKGHQSGNRGGRGTCSGGISNGNLSSLEQNFSTLAQRTGTLEGRHKQVQAKIALLDSAFGSKASDWAQTVRDILVEREVAAVASGSGSIIKGGGSRGAGRGGKKPNINNASNANNNTVVLSNAPQTSQGDENSSGRGTGNGACKRSIGITSQHSRDAESVASSPESSPILSRLGNGKSGEREGKGDDAHAAGRDTNRVNGTSDLTLGSTLPSAAAASTSEGLATVGKSGHIISATSDDVAFGQQEVGPLPTAGEASQPPEVVEPTPEGKPVSSSPCASCMETEERCVRLERRVLQYERELKLLQDQVADAVGQAAGAVAVATAAQTGMSKAVEAASAAESSVMVIRKEADGSDGRLRATAAANSATKSLMEKVAGDVRILAERTKEGEDALALVDHGLRTLREEVRSGFSTVFLFSFK